MNIFSKIATGAALVILSVCPITAEAAQKRSTAPSGGSTVGGNPQAAIDFIMKRGPEFGNFSEEGAIYSLSFNITSQEINLTDEHSYSNGVTIDSASSARIDLLDWPTDLVKGDGNGRCVIRLNCTLGKCFSNHRHSSNGTDTSVFTESVGFFLSKMDQCVRMKKAFDDLIRLSGGKYQTDVY